MNNSKIWLVVRPTVGIPLFLTAVAVGSFSVHVAVLSNTTWVADFLAGRELGSSASAAIAAEETKTVSFRPNGASFDLKAANGGAIDVVLPDGRKARLVIEDDVGEMAAVADPPT